jgi:hypothetical protein
VSTALVVIAIAILKKDRKDESKIKEFIKNIKEY